MQGTGKSKPDNRSDDLSLAEIASGDHADLSRWTTESLDGRRVDIFIRSLRRPGKSLFFLHGHAGILLNENAVFSRLFSTNSSRSVRTVDRVGGWTWRARV
ncbi:MAG: hypothetical protein R3C17_10940 [Planctomycetaceae bacterium]